MTLPTWLVQRVIFPLHERLRGRPTLREFATLRHLAAQPPAVVQQDARERLRALLLFAGAHLPHFTGLFLRGGVNAYADDVEAELRKLPVLTKADVRARAALMTWRDVPGGALPHASGGTTGTSASCASTSKAAF